MKIVTHYEGLMLLSEDDEEDVLLVKMALKLCTAIGDRPVVKMIKIDDDNAEEAMVFKEVERGRTYLEILL